MTRRDESAAGALPCSTDYAGLKVAREIGQTSVDDHQKHRQSERHQELSHKRASTKRRSEVKWENGREILLNVLYAG